MSEESFGGLGATEERKAKSSIVTGVREMTKGGMPINYGDRDEDHCALDYLLNKGFIERKHYDAGYALRELYYTFTKTGSWIDDVSRGHDGDIETASDIAYERYRAAVRSIGGNYRNLTLAICQTETSVPADWELIQLVIYGLEDLGSFFEKKFDRNFKNV